MKKGFLLPAICLSLAMPLTTTPSLAEKRETITLDETVVTATRYEENVESVPANITIITAADIENAAAYNIPDLLRIQTGLHVNDITGNRRSYTVDIRGYGETAALNTLVLVDGRRVNAADLSGTDWTTIPLDRVARIEIIRGGRSAVLYGDNAAGGVINIITKEGEAFGAGAKANGGSFETFGGTAYVNGLRGDLTYSLSASYLSSDGYRDNSDTEAKAFGGNLGFYPTDAIRVNLSAGYNEDNTGLPGALKDSDFAGGVTRTETTQPNDFADVEDYYFKGGPEIYLTDSSRFKIEGSYRKRKSASFATFAGGWFTGTTQIETIAVTPQFIVKQDVFGLESNLTIGMDYVRNEEDISNRSVFFGFPSEGRFALEKENVGYFIHEEIRPVDRLAISAGYRYDRSDFSFSPAVPDHTTLDEELATTGITYNVSDALDAYFSFSRSFGTPYSTRSSTSSPIPSIRHWYPRHPMTSKPASGAGSMILLREASTCSWWTQWMRSTSTRRSM